MIPFSPLPDKKLKPLAAHFAGIGSIFCKGMPSLGLHLKQINLGYSKEEYAGTAIVLAIFYFVLFSVLVAVILDKFIGNGLWLSIGIGLLVSFLIFIQVIAYPNILLKKKVRDLEQNIAPALRTVLIQIKSGVPLFDALQIIVNENYGILSREFEKAVKEIKAGKSQEDALQELTANNPSSVLRKAVWQVVNGLKEGAETSDVIQETVNTLNREERIEIRSYGNDLKFLSLMYMMIGVIIPTLGLTLIIVIGSFPKIRIDANILWGLLIMVIIMNFMYVGIIKSKRPALMR